eukprot:2461283-Rhodomonas_salina.1
MQVVLQSWLIAFDLAAQASFGVSQQRYRPTRLLCDVRLCRYQIEAELDQVRRLCAYAYLHSCAGSK